MAKSKSASKPSAPAVQAAGQMSVARKIAWWSLLAMLFLVPIGISNFTFLNGLGFQIQLPLTYDQFDIMKLFIQRVLTLIALGAWSWDMLTRGGKLRHTPVDWLILVFLAWVTVSTIFSIHPPTALFGKYRRFEGLLSFITYATAYFLVLQFADRPSRIKQAAQSLFFSGVLVAGYGAAQSFGRDMLQWGQLPFEANRSFSTYGNPDLLGGFLMFGVFISIALALAERNLVWRGVYWFGFLLNSYVVISAFTRSAWVGAFVGGIVFIIIAIRQQVDWKTEDWVFSGAAAAAVLGAAVSSLSNTNAVMNFGQRFVSIFQFGEGSAKTRFQIWSAAWRGVQDRPIFGFGPDTFRLIFPKYKPVEYVKDAGYLSVADNVHNYPLQLAAGIGIPGVLMFYGIFGWAMWRSAPLVFAREKSGSRMVLAGFWVACIAYLVHLLFGLSVTGSSLLLWMSVAVVLAPTATVREIRPPSWGWIPGALLIVAVVAGIGFHVRYLQADYAYLVSRIGAQGAERVDLAKKAARLNPYNDMYRAEVGLAITDLAMNAVRGAVEAQQTGGDPSVQLQEARELFEQAEAEYLDVIAFVPPEYDNYVFLANLYNLGGEYLDPVYFDRAIEISERGIEVEEYGPAIRFQYARALYRTGQIEKAIEQLSFAHEMDPAYSEAALLLSSYHEGQGDIESALRVLRESEEYRPGMAGIADAISRLESTPTTSAP